MTREEQKRIYAKKYYSDDFNCYFAFMLGAAWAEKYPNNIWISVEDRLPEQNKKVIVICEKLDTAPFYKISLGHIVDKTICKDNYNGWNIPNVVYWTPMPKLPEEI